MDGYSVTEAASVLGVPTERVWELLARGVLSGHPEGDTGMRVFLQPRPAPAPAATRDEPPRGNGSERGELSPFRELLTEFRSLTERYGQALLALGEARGEVASLRSRVDVLEARMELRLPFGGPVPEPWAGAQPPPAATAAQPTSTDADADAHEAQRTRRRGPRRATESFAEALARAEDPSTADLPSRPLSASPAVLPPDPLSAPTPEGGLPREALPAEIVPVADEEEPAYVDEDEDDEAGWGMEEDAGGAIAPGPSGAQGGSAPPALSEASPSVDEAWGGHDPAPVQFDEDRYTTSIESPDWLEAEVESPPAGVPSPAPDRARAESPPRSGHDEIEVIGMRSAVVTGAGELPGTRELGDALAAWDEDTVAPASSEGSYTPHRPVPRGREGTLPRGPATKAYRRLRRIFPE